MPCGSSRGLILSVVKGKDNIRTDWKYVFIPSAKAKQSHYRPGQAQRVLRKLRFPDFVTTAQDGGRLSALRTCRLYPQEVLLALISVRG